MKGGGITKKIIRSKKEVKEKWILEEEEFRGRNEEEKTKREVKGKR